MHLSGKPPLKQGIPIKAVEDHHVDRPRVKALQNVQPIGTNSLIVLSLFVCINYIRTSFIPTSPLLKIAFLEPVVIAKEIHSIPSRTRQ